MRVGDGLFDDDERLRINAAIRSAELASRIEFSVFVGRSDGADTRSFATQLHNSLVAPSRTIVIMVDPHKRAVEIVTGGWVRERVSDADVQAVADEMAERFRAGDLTGGITHGIARLAEKARTRA